MFLLTIALLYTFKANFKLGSGSVPPITFVASSAILSYSFLKDLSSSFSSESVTLFITESSFNIWLKCSLACKLILSSKGFKDLKLPLAYLFTVLMSEGSSVWTWIP